jgi:tetratricopeptide (TPR) repeat protein
VAGERLGLYTIDRELGAGGMGKVYAATVAERAPGLEIGERVALKVVHPHLLETQGFFMRFMREAQLGASIRHQNVVRTHHCDQVFDGGKPHAFLVMEYVEGQNLRALLNELEKVPEELCRHIGHEVAKGLAAVHAAGVVHRDLKPENVLITKDQVVKVMDLGIAQLADEQMRLSHSGAFVGSVEYAAPEQFGEDGVDHRCDLHALGLVLYELACGQHPYRGDDFRAVMRRVLDVEPRRAGDIQPQLSPFFEELIHTLLQKDRESRFGSAEELASVFESGEDSEWWHERAKALRARTSRPLRRIRIPRETAVYGREAEIARLRELYSRAKAGDAQVVLLEGEAGIGKSRLVDELVARLQSDGEDLNFLFGSYPPSGAATASGAFSAAFREHLGETGSAEYLTQTPILVPAFDAVLRGESAPTGAEPLTKDSLQTCFGNVTRSLAEERATVILIDDLHFAPDEGRGLFTSLATIVPDHRVLLVGTTRPGVSDDWISGLTRLQHTSHLTLGRLGPKDLAELLKDCLKSEQLAHSLGVQIGLKSDGNPFFAFEIIRGLREGQFITQGDDGTWASTRVIDEIQIPSSVLDLVNARVADLSEEERDLLDVACCWGFEFDPSLVAEVVGLARIPALKRFAQIERKHRLLRAAGRKMVFDHHQVQEALYGGLLEQLREEYHGALADVLAARNKADDTDPAHLDGAVCVDLCEHYLKGARGEDALRYLDASITHLRTGHLNEAVLQLARRALDVPGLISGADRGRLLWRLAKENSVYELMGDTTGQIAALDEALGLVTVEDDARLRGRLLGLIGLRLQNGPRHAETSGHLEEALRLARASGDREGEAFTNGNIGHHHVNEGRLEEGLAGHERQLAIAREAGSAHAEGNAHNNMSIVLRQLGRYDEAREHAQRAIAVHGAAGNRNGEASGHWELGLGAWQEGCFAEAREHMERQIALQQELGDRQGKAAGVGNLGLVFLAEGLRRDARQHYERGVILSRELGRIEGEIIGTGNLGSLDASEGRLEAARERIEWALATARDTGNRRSEAYALSSLASLLDAEGDESAAEAALRECLQVAEEMDLRGLVAATHLALGAKLVERADASGDDVEAGRAAMVRGLDIAREARSAGTEVEARCRLAQLPGGDPADALAAFSEHASRLGVDSRREVRFLLWKTTGDVAHLAEAKRLLDGALEQIEEPARDGMRANVSLNREILAAWAEAHPAEGECANDDDEPRDTESITRAG